MGATAEGAENWQAQEPATQLRGNEIGRITASRALSRFPSAHPYLVPLSLGGCRATILGTRLLSRPSGRSLGMKRPHLFHSSIWWPNISGALLEGD